MQHRIRHTVFYSPLALLIIGLTLSLVSSDWFFAGARQLVNSMVDRFDWLFSWSTFGCVMLMLVIYFSPLGKVRIGGDAAKPILTRWRWFAITLCTTIATGILFWGTAEPIFHLSSPPAGSGDDPAVFAMSSMFMHWTITPYSMYSVGGLTFALAYYNYKQPFRLSSMLYPLFGDQAHGKIGDLMDAVCLFSLVAGMAASLGAGILTLTGGLNLFIELPQNGFTYGLIGVVIVGSFLLSASTGLQKGIRIISNWNAIGFILLALFVLVLGPTQEMFALAGEGLLDFSKHFFSRSTDIGNPIDKNWQHAWTVFYWANWFAWAPITALFLGRLGVGYTVRQFIQTNLILPTVFGALWMIIFGGSSITFDGVLDGLFQSELATNGPESIAYQLLAQLPLANLTSGFFLVLVFLSYVTAADSNISAMSALSVDEISPENPEAPIYIRMIWGIVIGTVSWVMITFAGIDGIKIISNIGGFPAMILISLVGIGLVRMTFFGIKNVKN